MLNILTLLIYNPFIWKKYFVEGLVNNLPNYLLFPLFPLASSACKICFWGFRWLKYYNYIRDVKSRCRVIDSVICFSKLSAKHSLLCCFALTLPLVLIQRDIRWNNMSYIFLWEYMTRKVKIISINISIKYTVLEKTENLLGVKIHCKKT